jgi:hypothetical protein
MAGMFGIGPGLAFVAGALVAALLAALAAGGLGAVARSHVRMAAGLVAALSVGDLIAMLAGTPRAALFADAVGLLVLALLPPLLALAALAEERRRLRTGLAGLLLVLACAGGLAAAVTGAARFAVLPLVVSAAVLAGVGIKANRRAAALFCASGVSLLAAAASMGGSDGRIGIVLFLAAGVLGTVAGMGSDAPFQKPRERQRGGAVIDRSG